MIDLQGVTKQYGDKRAVDAVTFGVSAGESLALWGTNGAGKTTLLRCLLGATRFEGEISIDGISPARDGKKARVRIGYVPQTMPTFDTKVADMVLLVARLRGADRHEGIERLERFGLAHKFRERVDSLSGGMKQKLALTLALLGDPPILLLDEPTANLDARSQSELIGLLKELKQQGRTIVFTSHRWSEVRSLADRVVTLESGKQVGMERVTDLTTSTGMVDVRVNLDQESLDSAVELLGQHGFAAGRNGHSIQITVEPKRKAEPLVILAQSRIPVRDFEVEIEE